MNDNNNKNINDNNNNKSKAPLIVDLVALSRLKPLDVTFMKQLDKKINIVPVIAKADTLTKPELNRLKKRVSG